MAKRHDDTTDPCPDPCPTATYDEAVADVAKATRTLIDAGLGAQAAADVAIRLWCHCCDRNDIMPG